MHGLLTVGIGSMFRPLLALAMLLTTVAGSVTLSPRPAEAATARVTETLNLRSGPGLGYDVILVMAAGAHFKITGSFNKGFYPGGYDGIKGWASADYLSIEGGKPLALGPARTTDTLNLRSGPGTRYGVRLVMPAGASLKITGSYNKGFYPVRYQGTKGWASAEYLNVGTRSSQQPSPGSGGHLSLGAAKTTDSLNLRSGPGARYGVKLVMPEGATLKITGSYNKGYYPVRYQGTKGWASADYLTSAPGRKTWTTDQIIDFIYEAAAYYDQNGDAMLRVARCESNLDPYNVTSPHSASGLFQFLPGTWATTPYADENIFDPEINAYAAAWMWSVGRRNEWVCQ
jgi:uncharacterized protein YraI